MFDPAVLAGVEASLGDGSEVVPAGEDELRKIAGGEVRRVCASLKLASRIVGMAAAERGAGDDAHVLRSMELMVRRLGAVRKRALALVGVTPESPDYGATFNVLTGVVLDALTEEWKWGRLGEGAAPLPVEAIGKLLEMASSHGPVYMPQADEGDVKTVRRLCVMEAMPKVWGLVNLFDYYQPQREAMVGKLLKAVSEQAEACAGKLTSEASPTFGVRAIVQRAYGVSAGLMCEVYKEAARRDVAALRAMPELERSVHLASLESIGMKYDHIIERHRTVMERMLDTAHLVLEAQQRGPQASLEGVHAER